MQGLLFHNEANNMHLENKQINNEQHFILI